jgi:hypothetical protein
MIRFRSPTQVCHWRNYDEGVQSSFDCCRSYDCNVAGISAGGGKTEANAGGDEMTGDDPIFNGGPGRAYNEFYAAMKSWGRFEIVNSPADADLLLEIRQYVSAVTPTGRGSSSFIPQFGLKIRDPKTNAILWGFNVHSQFGAGQADSDRNFSSAVGRLATEVRILVAPPEPAVQ